MTQILPRERLATADSQLKDFYLGQVVDELLDLRRVQGWFLALDHVAGRAIHVAGFGKGEVDSGGSTEVDGGQRAGSTGRGARDKGHVDRRQGKLIVSFTSEEETMFYL